MNNEQFRRLLFDQSHPSKPKEQSSTTTRDAAPGSATQSGLLGSRMRSSIPMTPRSLTGVDFARQLAEHRRETEPRPTKRFKSSAAPKGTKLPAGYHDRAQLRTSQNESEDDLQNRVKALEEMVKLGQIDQATFDKLRAELGVGGDLDSTHMVTGLDWKLLRRVRAGEDVSHAAENPAPETIKDTEVREEDADEEFERLIDEKGQEEVQPVPKEKKEKKKGAMVPPPPRKKTRDEILRELKASRAAAANAKPESTLGSKFKKLGDSKPEKKRFVEQDESGRRREVLLITDAEGKTKRKVRWLDPPTESTGSTATKLPMPDKSARPLGMEVPAEIAAKATAPQEEDDDIFAGIGADYNPLAGIEDDDGSSSEDSDVADTMVTQEEQAVVSEGDQKLPAGEAPPTKTRNYFATATSAPTADEPDDRSNPLTKDPTIVAALKRAAALRQASPSGPETEGESPEASLRHKRFLEEARRRDALDAADMDLGFGGSRIDDEEDEEGALLDFEDRGGKKRKRGPKKKKGNKDSAVDVMRVVEGRKKDPE